MDRRPNNWYNEIAPPGKSTLSDSVGYLDRMLGSSGMRDKQFLRPGGPKQAKNNNGARPRQQQTDRFNKNPASNQVKAPNVVDIDDANWIEARKKRFPKTNDDLHNKSTQPQCDNETAPQVSAHTPSQPSSSAHIGRPAKVDCDSNVPRRKKTLFEKLMDPE